MKRKISVNFESHKKREGIHVTISINKETLRDFRILFPNVNLSKSVENSMINEIIGVKND